MEDRMKLFKDLHNYGDYLKENPFHKNLGDLEEYNDLKKNINKELTPNPDNNVPYPIDIDDLIHLHYLVTSRKVTTILEYGVGKSTTVFEHALEQNKIKLS